MSKNILCQLFLVFCFMPVLLTGCGGNEPTATSGNEIGDYLKEHPELVEAAAQADKEFNDASN